MIWGYVAFRMYNCVIWFVADTRSRSVECGVWRDFILYMCVFSSWSRHWNDYWVNQSWLKNWMAWGIYIRDIYGFIISQRFYILAQYVVIKLMMQGVQMDTILSDVAKYQNSATQSVNAHWRTFKLAKWMIVLATNFIYSFVNIWIYFYFASLYTGFILLYVWTRNIYIYIYIYIY